MKAIKSISVPTPCQETWGNMSETQNGRFCHLCQRQVIDFTKMTDQEVVTYMASASERVCGRFANKQITYQSDGQLTGVRNKSSYNYLKYGFAALIAGAFTLFGKVQAARTNSQNHYLLNHQPDTLKNGKIRIVVEGRILDEKDNLGIAYVSIKLKSSYIGTQTDTTGRYRLSFYGNEGDVLNIKFIGYEDQRIIIKDVNRKKYNIWLKPAQNVLGEVVIKQ